MKLPETLTKKEKLERVNFIFKNSNISKVEQIISELSLRKCENNIVGDNSKGISGGERKRVFLFLI